MKSKKSLFPIFILSFLFITNFVMFIIIQRPLYAEECNYQECTPLFCEADVRDWCDWACENIDSWCEDVELVDAYCAPTPWFDCECFSLWNVICENEFSFYRECHEMSYQCPNPY